MDGPRPIPGMCPHYNQQSSRCYLTEVYQDGGRRDYCRKPAQSCKTCGNCEAWASRSNYLDK